ncbi:MAG: alpha/beta fold hydrolase [Xanthomonadales bacterium]|nr:alpha/beta fold hydrolase [Xanthomonadales bacterium]
MTLVAGLSILARMEPSPPVARQLLPASDGIPLAVEAYGERRPPAVLFAHGFGQTRLAWRATARRAAAAGFHAVCVDGRGHGESGRNPPERPYAVADFVADLETVAASLPGRPALVGASMGGLLGLLAEGPGAGRTVLGAGPGRHRPALGARGSGADPRLHGRPPRGLRLARGGAGVHRPLPSPSPR